MALYIHICPYISLMEKQPQGSREKVTSPHLTLLLQTLPHVDTDLSFKYQLQVHRTFSARQFYRCRNRKARVHPKPALQVYPKLRTSPLQDPGLPIFHPSIQSTFHTGHADPLYPTSTGVRSQHSNSFLKGLDVCLVQ